MRQVLLLVGLLNSTLLLQAQDTLRLSRGEAEALFLQNNLLLISEQLHIESQQAEVIQAKAWPNPEFSIDEVNLWTNTGVDPSPPFWGNFGRNQQVSFQLNQLVQTAGKRKKLIALEKVDVEKAGQYLEDLLRALKLELRNQLTELQYLQQSITVHQRLRGQVSTLTAAYKNQLDNGNIPKAEYIRLKAEELELDKAVLTRTQEADAIQKELKMLLRTAPTVTLVITDDGFMKDTQPYRTAVVGQLLENALQYRPDYRLALLEQDYSTKSMAYEKAQRMPDLTVGLGYDRNGSTMLDFVGVGVSFDLPIFDRNKGGIKKAAIGIKQANVQKEQKRLAIENEVLLSYRSLKQAIDFLDGIESGYEDDLESLLENYTRNLLARNVDMVEYLDFMDAYLINQNIILEARKDINQKAEELHYALGQDI